MAYYRSKDPLRDAIEAITGKRPACVNLSGVKHSRDLTDVDHELLYEWCTQNARPHWATGLSILEAAELLVERAIENDNI